jgi:hypothetical protein
VKGALLKNIRAYPAPVRTWKNDHHRDYPRLLDAAVMMALLLLGFCLGIVADHAALALGL